MADTGTTEPSLTQLAYRSSREKALTCGCSEQNLKAVEKAVHKELW